MRAIMTSGTLALSLALAGSGLVADAMDAGSAVAQTTPATGADSATPATPAAGEVKQIPLTPALIEQFVAAKKDIDTVLEKMPDGTDEPDPGTMSKLDAVAKKYKFAGYKDYDAVENNIGIVMAGIDPDAKRYIGVDAVIKKQVADIQADKQISAKDKKDTIDQLNATLPTIPKLQFPGNVDVVVKNYDRLNEAMPQD